jgi:NAD(P)-dependent dehydrogenase (short-subunit alcohol dehydrogenase family)
MATKKLADKIAVITGGSSGMGLATAKLFVAEGAYVFITGRRQSELDAAVKEIGTNVTAIRGDVSKLAELDRVFEMIAMQKGRIDVLFANAGVGEFVAMGSITEEHFDKIMDINVKGTLFTVQKALPLFKNGGSIIMTGSVAGSKGIGNFGVYNASKAAIRSFARTWTNDLKGKNIRVNVLSPGPIDTPILAPLPKEAIANIVAGVPMGRMGTSDEIATVALFLASNDSSYVSGVELFVDGGTASI